MAFRARRGRAQLRQLRTARLVRAAPKSNNSTMVTFDTPSVTVPRQPRPTSRPPPPSIWTHMDTAEHGMAEAREIVETPERKSIFRDER